MKNKIKFIFTIFLYTTFAFAQYKISQSVIGNSGLVTAKSSHRINGTVGQNIIGSARGSSFSSIDGFKYLPKRIITDSSGTGVVVYSRSGASGRTIWMRATDGSFDTMVISGGSWPRLSHNSRYILFHKGNGDPAHQGMFLYDLQTRTDTLLRGNNDYLVCYDWFDDDYHVVFDQVCGIYIMNSDLTGFTTLYQVNCYDDAPVARPGSWAIAHHSNTGIILTDSLGVNRHQLSNTGAGDYWPSWSPDGQWIAFMRRLNDTTYNYYKIRPDGTGLTALTAFTTIAATFNEGGAWTLDASKIIVAGRINGVQGMYAIATDGSYDIELVQTAAGDPIDFVGSVTGNVNIQLTDIHEEGKRTPSRFELLQNYPNPFNPSTTIKFEIPNDGTITLKIFDVLGKVVETLVNEQKPAGKYEVDFDGSELTSGIYFYQLRAGNYSETKKMILIK
jgi:hypothetical protein